MQTLNFSVPLTSASTMRVLCFKGAPWWLRHRAASEIRLLRAIVCWHRRSKDFAVLKRLQTRATAISTLDRSLPLQQATAICRGQAIATQLRIQEVFRTSIATTTSQSRVEFISAVQLKRHNRLPQRLLLPNGHSQLTKAQCAAVVQLQVNHRL